MHTKKMNVLKIVFVMRDQADVIIGSKEKNQKSTEFIWSKGMSR